jgi:two-component system, sensor histidine kinase RegB
VAQESRRLSDALAAAQAALDREQRVSSLGALAAAAAHELGSPLGTISLVAKELARDLPADSPHRSDADLLVGQSERCREILAELSRKPDQKDHFHFLPAGLLVELAAAPHARPHVALRIEFSPDPSEPRDPVLPRRPEIMHGLGNLLQNAIEFAREEVKVVIAWTRAEIVITITDDGPGFPHDVLRRLGDPYLSGSSEGLDPGQRQGDHMGLGIFIAQNLIERTGGTVGFSNNDYGGAEARLSWPRGAF